MCRSIAVPQRGPVLVAGVSSGTGLATVLHLAGLGFHAIGTVRDTRKVDLVTGAASRRGLPVRPGGRDRRVLRVLRTLDGRIHPPSVVAEVIGTALTARRPEVRYQAGREVALLRAAGEFVPWRVRDVAVRTMLGR